ncbi:archaeosortase/exosortase family protein [Leptolyngbya sp. CCNP1308]|uniref:archaeosortase/exosortase family protein n=1 Tax=Leptolyngbya sp. CCNP1308 TaxID=3110255 RepID=UPI002B20F6A6|nr:archaeosortase/exosortase family protein [Leptolyngbya sp. CCNP1308]MEA5452420.1 archaeosortase/exosortase family protein [Leptolyngbya sp. CCNP1308]
MAIRRLPNLAWSRLSALRIVGVGLAGLHLVLIVQVTGSLDQLVFSGLFWVAIAAHGQQHWPDRLPRSRPSLLLGLTLVGGLIVKSWPLGDAETAFVRLFPLFAWAGWFTLVQGWRWLPWRQSWALVLALSVPPRAMPLLLETILDAQIRTATAAIAAFVLHYVGFDVVQQNSLIQLPGGTVDVEFACTGAALLGLLLQVSVLLTVATGGQHLGHTLGRLAGWSIAIAALLSAIRVAIMAAVVSNAAAFQFWHGASGGQIFTLIALAGLGYLGLGQQGQAEVDEPSLSN